MVRKIKNLILWLYVRFFNLLGAFFIWLPIKGNKVVAVNMFGREPGDNLEPVTQFLSQNFSVEVVWLVNNPKELTSTESCRYVKYGGIQALKELATAKIWLDNSRKNFYPPKRKEQIYYQFWHGGLGIKKIEKDAVASLNDYYVWLAQKDSKMVDYMISNSSHLTNLYLNSFWYSGKILEYGYPKEIKLIEEFKKRQEEFKSETNQEIRILFAPTFRDYPYDPMNLDFTRLLKKIEIQTNKKASLYLRPHPINKRNSYHQHLSEKIKDISQYGNIQEVIVNVDVLITDYSSIMFDSLIAGVRTILYVPDKEQYFSHRGSYFKLSELPFSLAMSEDDLIQVISEKDNNFLLKRKEFLEKTGYIDRTDSCEKISRHILFEIEKDE